MKRGRLPVVIILVCVAVTATATADNSQVGPISNQDPDGVPQVVTDAKQKKDRQAAMNVSKDDQQKADDNKDWLLRSYEEQMRNTPVGQENSSLYQFTADKTSSTTTGSKTTLSSGQKNTTPATAVIPSSTTTSRADSTMVFKPLVTPLSSGDSTSIGNMYSSLPSAPLPAGAETKRVDPAKDPALMETPGMTAAASDPSFKFNLDQSDSLPQDGARQGTVFGAGLSSGTSAELMQKQTDAAFAVPGVVRATAVQAGSVNSTPPVVRDDPKPDKIPQPSPVRPPIADPLEIPYH